MKKLWAPWRINYIKHIPDKDTCIFCEVSAERKDRKNFILYRGKKVFTVLNIFPYNSGHLMVAPYRHTGDLAKLEDVGTELFRITSECVRILKKSLNPDGFNIGINLGKEAGAGFEEHLHIHIVPRWKGDTNFMPVIGETKVIPQAIEDTFETLKPEFDNLNDTE